MKTKKTKTLTALFLMAALTVGSFQSTQVTLKAKETEIEWNKATAKKYGWLTKKGYKLVGTVGNGLLKISNKKGDKFGIAKKDKTILYKPKFDYISEKAAWGYIDWEASLGGNIKIGIYDMSKREQYRTYDEGEFPGTYGLLSKEGEEVLPFEYEEISGLSEGLLYVKKDGLFGYLNEKLETIIPFQYEEADIFRNGYSSVKKDGKYGVIDKTGNIIVPFEFEQNLRDYSFGYTHITAKKGEKYGVIDRSGKTLMPFKYDGIGYFSDEFYSVEKDGKYGLIDKKGKTVIPFKYDDYFRGSFPDFIVAQKGYNYGVIDSKGKVKIPFKYENIEFEGKNLKVRKDGGEGIIDKKGKIIIPAKYYLVIEYTDLGLFYVETKLHKKGILDKKGKVIIPAIYDDIYTGEYGIFSVHIGEKVGYIDKKGKVIVPVKYDWDTAQEILQKKLKPKKK